jgi:hypothetical protein
MFVAGAGRLVAGGPSTRLYLASADCYLRRSLMHTPRAHRLTRRLAATAVVFGISACAHVRLQSPIAATPGPPPTFVPTTSDVRSTRVIDLRDNVSKTAAFKAAADLLTQRLSIDVRDEHSGFLMTPWQSSFMRNGAPDLHYRTRIIIRFLGDDWKQASVRSEANWQRGDDEWDIGYDTRALDEVANDLKSRIGKTP